MCGSGQTGIPAGTMLHLMSSPSTILVVDDNEGQRYSVCRALQMAGFTTIEACNGSDGLLRIRELPNLVVLDVRLPDIDGFEVCRRMKADTTISGVPVVLVSAAEQSRSAVNDAVQVGAVGYLFHPFSPEQLIAVVKGCLAKSVAKATSAQIPIE